MRSLGGRFFRLAILVALLTLVPARPAWAHADLLGSTPSNKALLGEAPTAVVLRYNEGVTMTLGSVKVLAPDGSRVDTAKVQVRDQGRTVVEGLRAGLPRGTFTVLWRAVTEDDGHSVAGAFTFSVKEASATAASTSSATASLTATGRMSQDLLAAARFLLYLGFILLFGVGAFLLVLWPQGIVVPAARRLLWTGWLLSVLGSAAGLLLQGPYAAGRPVTSALDPGLISEVLHTRYGIAALVRLGLLAAIIVVLWKLGPIRRPLRTTAAGVLSVGVLLSTSAVGHASSGDMRAVAWPSDAVHLGAASAWLGGLVLLATVLLRQDPTDLAALLPRWSRYAATAVTALMITGAFAGWREVRGVDAAVHTSYGQLLLLKIGFVAATLALGQVGRSWIQRHYAVSVVPATLTTTVERPVPTLTNVTRLRRSVLMEAGTGAVVLAIAAVLVQTAPARIASTPAINNTSAGSGACVCK